MPMNVAQLSKYKSAFVHFICSIGLDPQAMIFEIGKRMRYLFTYEYRTDLMTY